MSLQELGHVITALTALGLVVVVLVMTLTPWVRIWRRVVREEREAAERRRVEKAKRAREEKPRVGFQIDEEPSRPRTTHTDRR